MGYGRVRQIASLANEMGISRTFDLHGVRCGSMSFACNVRARGFGQVVLGTSPNVDHRGKKSSKASKPTEMQTRREFFAKKRAVPGRPQAVPNGEVSYAEFD